MPLPKGSRVEGSGMWFANGSVSTVMLSKMRKPEKSFTSGTDVDRMVNEVMFDQLGVEVDRASASER